MNTCQALSVRFIGKGPDRKAYDGPCVLELGHDLDHLPATLAYEQGNNRVYNEALDECKALVETHMREGLNTPILELLETLRRGV